MLGNFSYSNPTKLYFGEEALDYLNEELQNYGDRVLLTYGSGSIQKSGLYDQVIDILEKNGKSVFEVPGVIPNPTVGSILTMVGTGSEMNGGSVITNHESKQKIGHVFGEEVFPKFSILNPRLTFSVPRYQMVAGIFDIMSHILEQYFSGTDDNTSDYLSEGLMRSLVHSSRIAITNPEDYEARSNIMWTVPANLTKKSLSQDSSSWKPGCAKLAWL